MTVSESEMAKRYEKENAEVRKSGKNTGAKVLCRMVGIGLFIAVLTFAKLIETLPTVVTVPAAITYFLAEYKLLVK